MKSVRRKDIATSLKRSALPTSMNLSSLGIMSRLTNHHIYSALQVFYDGKRRALPRNLKMSSLWSPVHPSKTRISLLIVRSSLFSVMRHILLFFPLPASYPKCLLQYTKEVS